MGRARDAYRQLLKKGENESPVCTGTKSAPRDKSKTSVEKQTHPRYYFVVDNRGVAPPVRASPDQNSSLLFYLKKGDVVQAFDHKHDWVGVQIGIIQGWTLLRGTPRRQFLFPCSLCSCRRAAPLGRHSCCRSCRITKRGKGESCHDADVCQSRKLLTEKHLEFRLAESARAKRRRDCDLSELDTSTGLEKRLDVSVQVDLVGVNSSHGSSTTSVACISQEGTKTGEETKSISTLSSAETLSNSSVETLSILGTEAVLMDFRPVHLEPTSTNAEDARNTCSDVHQCRPYDLFTTFDFERLDSIVGRVVSCSLESQKLPDFLATSKVNSPLIPNCTTIPPQNYAVPPIPPQNYAVTPIPLQNYAVTPIPPQNYAVTPIPPQNYAVTPILPQNYAVTPIPPMQSPVRTIIASRCERPVDGGGMDMASLFTESLSSEGVYTCTTPITYPPATPSEASTPMLSTLSMIPNPAPAQDIFEIQCSSSGSSTSLSSTSCSDSTDESSTETPACVVADAHDIPPPVSRQPLVGSGQWAALSQLPVVFGVDRSLASERSVTKDTVCMMVLNDATVSATHLVQMVGSRSFDFVMVPMNAGNNMGYGVVNFVLREDLVSFREEMKGVFCTLSTPDSSARRIEDVLKKESAKMCKPNEATVVTQEVRFPALVSLRGRIPSYALPNEDANIVGHISGKKIITEFVGQFAKVDTGWIRRCDVKTY